MGPILPRGPGVCPAGQVPSATVEVLPGRPGAAGLPGWATIVRVIVITRYSVPEADTEAFQSDAAAAVEALSRRPGFRRHRVGRAVDDPGLWTVVTEWEGVGFYRRALSDFDVKVNAVPLLSRAIDEPTAFEILTGDDAPE